MSDYDQVSRGKLKLKNSGVNKKKKKDSSKVKKKIKEAIAQEVKMEVQKTAAELAFEKVREKRSADEILKMASKSHRDKIKEMNEKLERLSEHNDVPKVSWTK